MNVLFIPLLAALTQALSLILHKIGLTRRNISLEQYIPVLFLFLTLYAALTLPFLGWINIQEMMSLRNIALVGTIIAFAIVWNVLYFMAIKSEHVNLIENILSLSPLTTIVVAWIFIPENFDMRVAYAGLIATVAMMWGYWHKHKLRLSHTALLLFLSVFFMSLENVLVGLLLQERNIAPVTLFTIRTAVMSLFFLLYYKPKFFVLGRENVIYLALIGSIGTTMMLLRFYGLRDSGIVFTSLILILVPFMVFLASMFILHEKVRIKQIITMVIVLLAVWYATMLQG